jgi:hypothetical protein
MDIEMETCDECKAATARDIVIDLREFLKDAPEAERAGMLAAIEIITNNY